MQYRQEHGRHQPIFSASSAGVDRGDFFMPIAGEDIIKTNVKSILSMMAHTYPFHSVPIRSFVFTRIHFAIFSVMGWCCRIALFAFRIKNGVWKFQEFLPFVPVTTVDIAASFPPFSYLIALFLLFQNTYCRYTQEDLRVAPFSLFQSKRYSVLIWIL